MTFWDPFRSHHVCLSVVLVYQGFCTFLAQPKGYGSLMEGGGRRVLRVGVGEFDGGRGGRRVLQREVWGQVSGRGKG